MNRPLASLALLFAIGGPCVSIAHAADDVVGGLITFKKNGGWSWFSNNTIIFDHDKMLVGSVAGVTDSNGTGGDIQLTTWNRGNLATSQTNLHAALERDDHDAPAFLVRPDGKYLVTYQRHGADDFLRWRISTTPGSTSSFTAEQTVDVNPDNNFGNTYTNLYRLSAEGRTYNFSRSVGYDPNYAYSDNNGDTWTYGDRWMFFNNPTNNNASGGRPYVRYASNNVNRIWLETTDDHPRDYGNSIYAGYIQSGNTYTSTGTLQGPLFTPGVTTVQPSNFTKIYAGDNNHRAWTTDIELDPATGNPFLAFSVREIVNSVTTYKYYVSRFNGSTWNTNFLGYAGNYLYAAENDYTGLVALDPQDPNTLYVSSDVDPKTGAAVGTGKHEIYKGITTDQGATWNWLAITSNSTVDNIRPIVPTWDSPERMLLWLRGTYTTYQSYSLDVVGQIHYAPGDVNGDRTVNFNDLLLLAQHYGVAGTQLWADGDFTGDGVVNFDDLLILSQHYGESSAPGASLDSTFAALSAVPEPAGLALLSVATLALRRQRS